MFLNNLVFGQNTAENILRKYKENLNSVKKYQCDITYKIFKGHKTSKPNDISNGLFFKNGNKMYAKINEVEIVNTPSFYLKINHIEKAILMANGVDVGKNSTQFDLSKLLAYLDIASFKSNKEKWEIDLKSKPITQLPFSLLKIFINKETLNLEKQVFFYTTKMNFSKDARSKDIDKVKLEVIYMNYKNKAFSVPHNVFFKNNYLSLSNRKYIGIKEYKNYQIIDVTN